MRMFIVFVKTLYINHPVKNLLSTKTMNPQKYTRNLPRSTRVRFRLSHVLSAAPDCQAYIFIVRRQEAANADFLFPDDVCFCVTLVTMSTLIPVPCFIVLFWIRSPTCGGCFTKNKQI